jgi:hypothetical protein
MAARTLSRGGHHCGVSVRGTVARRRGSIDGEACTDGAKAPWKEPARCEGKWWRRTRAHREGSGVLMFDDRGIVRRFGADRLDPAVVRDRGNPVATAGMARSIGAAAVLYHRSPPRERADDRSASAACPRSHSLPRLLCRSVDMAIPPPLNSSLTTNEQGAGRRPQSQAGDPRLRTREGGRRASGWRDSERASAGGWADASTGDPQGLGQLRNGWDGSAPRH